MTGITLDKDDLMLVSIKEIVENPVPPPPSSSSGESGDSSGEDEQKTGSLSRKRKRKRKKHRTADGETPAKTSKTGDDDDGDLSDGMPSEARTDDNLDTPTSTPAKRHLFSSQNTPAGADSNMESNDSYFTLHDIKQDHSDDDLIEIIKEEPGLTSPGGQPPPHIVSIQSLHSASSSMSQPPLPAAMNPNMPSGSGQMPPGLQMAPGQYEDLMQV